MSAATEVRRARRGDLPAIVEIEEATFSEAWTPETFASGLERDDMAVLVATEGEVVAGYAVVVIGDGEAELANLAVSTARRGRGIGEALLEGALEVLRDRGASCAYLAVRASNERAARLYRRHGFREIGTHAGYYARPREDALVLALDL
ncbi:MAG: ribosomal-protein-alanine N-acetyltransferase [Gemmatimonadetes bacterium]|nr:ribosomal-protein-alanine N-acetyltransferase [Gemmatimonadota bacterium]MYI06682.1 ribosomal-protein-alanine N-acetyltransferase [Gemmatimonadota bacterium]